MEAQIFSLVWLTLPGCAPNRLPVIARWKTSLTKINKKRFRAFRSSNLLEIIAQACWTEKTVKNYRKITRKIVLQNLIDFLCFHTKESEDLDHSMKKSEKRKLSRSKV